MFDCPSTGWEIHVLDGREERLDWGDQTRSRIMMSFQGSTSTDQVLRRIYAVDTHFSFWRELSHQSDCSDRLAAMAYMSCKMVPLSVADLLAQASRAVTADQVATEKSPFEALAAELDATTTSSNDPATALRLLAPVGHCIRQLSSEAWPEFDLFRRLCERLCQLIGHDQISSSVAKLQLRSINVAHDQDQPFGQREEVKWLAVSLLCHTTASSAVC